MALALRQPDDDARFDLWVPVEDAARLIGCTDRHLRRQCADEYEKQGLARKVDGKWVVSPRLDERLIAKDPRQRDRESAAELAKAGIPAKQIDRALAIRDLIHAFDAFDTRGMTAHEARENFIAHADRSGLLKSLDFGKRPGLRTFYEWQKRYASHGLAGLVRKSVERQEIVRSEAAFAFIEQLVKSGNRISINQAITIAFGEAQNHKGDPAWEIPSYSKVRLIIKQRMPKIMRVISEKGVRAAQASCIPKSQTDFDTIPAGAEYVGDECTLDIVHRVWNGRKWIVRRGLVLTGWMDRRSRMLVGWVTEPFANSQTILGSMEIAIRTHGKPDLATTDWGKDYRSAIGTGLGKRFKRKGIRDFDGKLIASIFDQMGVDVRAVMPYRPWSKLIESYFRTQHNLFDKLQPGYWGGSPAMRHEERMEWCKRNVEKLPTADQVVSEIAIAIDAYHHTPHRGGGMFDKSPLEVMAEFRMGRPIRRETDDVLTHLFKLYIGPKKILRDGIRHFNRLYRSPSYSHVQYLGESVFLAMQADDVGRAMVCRVDDNRTPLFEVEATSLRGLSNEGVKELMKQERRTVRPFVNQFRASQKSVRSIPAEQMLRLQLDGAKARYGDRSGDGAESGESTVRARPDLEHAISNAERIRIDEASEAVRTGTDDTWLEDLADEQPPTRRPLRADEATDIRDFFDFGTEDG